MYSGLNPSDQPYGCSVLRHPSPGLAASFSDFRRKWKQRYVSGLLDRPSQRALVRRACAGQPAWKDFTAFGDEGTDQFDVLIVDKVDLFDAEFADLAAAEELLAPTGRTLRISLGGFRFFIGHRYFTPLILRCRFCPGVRLGGGLWRRASGFGCRPGALVNTNSQILDDSVGNFKPPFEFPDSVAVTFKGEQHVETFPLLLHTIRKPAPPHFIDFLGLSSRP